MPSTTPGIAYLDADRVHRALYAGIKRVIDDQEHLNKINVYPVPDGDTGTNLALTMSAIHAALGRHSGRSAGQLFTDIADAAIDGARGNSGAIMAQFLQGMSDALTGLIRISAVQFAQAVKTGEAYARDALAKPVEGTVLTVMGDFADRLLLRSGAKPRGDFVPLWRDALSTAQTSLARTPTKLEALRKAGVVDAGAEGFVRLLQGVADYIEAGDIATTADIGFGGVQHSEGVAAGEAVDLEYRYCTECVITGHEIDRRRLKETLMELGGSLVLAGTHSKTRVHIHVNDPNDVFRLAGNFGDVGGTKADDMQRQQHESHRTSRRIAVVMDSAGDIPDEELERAQIHMTPVRLHFGRESYLDKVTISSEEFYARLKSSPEPPKTSQPAPGDFRRDFQFLCSHYEAVVCINLLASASGTYQSALTAAQRSGAGERIHVIDSKSVSVGEGLLALFAADCVAAGHSASQVRDAVLEARERTSLYAVVRDLSSAVRGGRVRAPLKTLVEFFNLTPVLGVRRNGRFGPLGVLFGQRNIVSKTARFILKRLDRRKRYRIAVAHADCEADARDLLARLQEGIPHIENSYFTQVGSALGAHAGPSAIAAAVQEYTPPAPPSQGT